MTGRFVEVLWSTKDPNWGQIRNHSARIKPRENIDSGLELLHFTNVGGGAVTTESSDALHSSERCQDVEPI